ncbi:chorismate mutase AroH [Paenibacillus larvae subsp. larvae]|uniref:chorismate mutase n=1 Tax=Paenibacillus larvae subsp. larvae TaxID=147375 RepID=A0A2L1UCA8_9BACL|nr:chorismate mutase [Paenibacillus larvae]AQT86257.1 chorismate mutase [Paenibacillus larvae subsp. pulvifaciens]AQZ47892.1 chorismate mutase [Paenibacillus larvae subsp. pulvifaciens]AVF25789.1 chorismate mutase AroH [Paenibacillus larvae subsp. larvae]AVF30566.1 chorismate mutase AroH [Paenibacillus larvae subsp. larvae]MBH0341978.1 chorismate mutase [Paenibacillus larvae]
MYVRGIRGATTVEAYEEKQILEATTELLEQIVAHNAIRPEDICSVLITVTHDLTSAFPAKAIRGMKGWELVPLMCSMEIPVPGSLERCIRMMVLTNTGKNQNEIRHIYLKTAKKLRPDILELTAK